MARSPKSSLTRLAASQRRVDQAHAAAAVAQRLLVQAKKDRDDAFEKAVVKLARAAGLDRLSHDRLDDAIRSLGGRAEEPVTGTSRARTASAESEFKAPRGSRAPRGDGATVMVSVRYTSNGSSDKKDALQAAGLLWNGKRGVHRGRVDKTTLAKLKEVFGPSKVTVDPTDEGIAQVNTNDPPDAGDGGSAIHEAKATEGDNAPRTEKLGKVDRRREAPPHKVADDTPLYVCATFNGITIPTSSPTAPETLNALVGAVVKDEGPIHRDLVCDRIRAALSLPRLLPSLKTAIDEICSGLPRDPRVEDDEGFLLIPEMPIHVRDRHESPDSIRHYDRLPLSELRVALAEAPTRDGAKSEKDLIRAVGRRLGYGSVSHGLAARIRQARKEGAKM